MRFGGAIWVDGEGEGGREGGDRGYLSRVNNFRRHKGGEQRLPT